MSNGNIAMTPTFGTSTNWPILRSTATLAIKRIRKGEIPGPRLTVSDPWITRVYLEGVPDEYQLIIDSPREAAQRTRELIARGSDLIKTWVGLTEEDYRAVVNQAHQHNVKVHAHLYRPEAIRAAIAAGVDVFQHVGSARNPAYDKELVSEIAHKNIPVVDFSSNLGLSGNGGVSGATL